MLPARSHWCRRAADSERVNLGACKQDTGIFILGISQSIDIHNRWLYGVLGGRLLWYSDGAHFQEKTEGSIFDDVRE